MQGNLFGEKARGQFSMWVVAFLFFYSWAAFYHGGLNLNKLEQICNLFAVFFAAAITSFIAHLEYEQGYISRAIWLGLAVFGLYATWTLYQPFMEAARYDLLQKHSGTPDVVEWLAVARIGYFLLLAILASNLCAALYIVTKNTIADFKGEGEGEDRGSNWTPAESRIPAPRPVSDTQDKHKLETRDTQAVQPRYTFDDLAGNEALKEKLWDAVQAWNNGGKKDGKNGLFLYGPPGTGKTAFAEALAGEVGLKIIKANVGSIASRFVNQSVEQLNHLVDSALNQAPCVLFLDEAETVLTDRSRIERGDSEEAKLVTTFLKAVDEKLRHGRVLLVAATNYKDRCDDAAIREGRFDFHVEVGFPDFAARKGLIEVELKRAGKTVDAAVLERLAKRWAGFNVKRIMEAAQRGCGFAKTKDVGMADFMRGLRDVQGNKTGVAETALGLSDLYFDAPVKERLQRLAVEFARSDEIEAVGGAVSKGVIFYGPPGTGKTTMAQALAKESGMTFIATNGKKILSSEKELQDICRKASDLRPSIVFIDEADDILADRSTSGLKLHTNDLLSTIDGAGQPMPDVVWVLATNSIDSLDEAVGRRFGTKMELPIPGIEAITAMVANWAAKVENTDGSKREWVSAVSQAVEGLSPSMVRSILDAAKNHAAVESVVRGRTVEITLEMVMEARREMRA